MNLILQKTALCLAVIFIVSCQTKKMSDGVESVVQPDITIPMEGNSWVTSGMNEDRVMVQRGGIRNWKQDDAVIGVFFKTTTTGKILLALDAKNSGGVSKLKVSMGSASKEVTVQSQESAIVPVGEFFVSASGYQHVVIQGISKTGDDFADVASLLVGGDACSKPIYFVKDDFYWGRRGPSVHMGYQIPEGSGDIKWFYNEVIVPKNEDVVGTYFMANGFGEGYFGIQVNSEIERRILFSVWSPFVTDDPNAIPDDHKIVLLKKGADVRIGEFGNEGSGGQSYRIFNWQSDVKYAFLLKVEPSGNNETDYTAYFKNPKNDSWELIASFRRPHTNTWMRHPHSFLENFITHGGHISRKGFYGNQWVCNTEGQWVELVKGRFTADATARKESRMDYAGGVEDGRFFLKNCGFFSETTQVDQFFDRPATGSHPQIDFDALP